MRSARLHGMHTIKIAKKEPFSFCFFVFVKTIKWFLVKIIKIRSIHDERNYVISLPLRTVYPCTVLKFRTVLRVMYATPFT